MPQALVWLGGEPAAAPSPLCVPLGTLGTEVSWASCFSPVPGLSACPYKGCRLAAAGSLGVDPQLTGGGGGVAGGRTPTPLLLRHERKPAGALLTDFFLSFPTPLGIQKRK